MNNINKIITTTLVLGSILSTAVLAEGSKVQDSTLISDVDVKNSQSIATGVFAEAIAIQGGLKVGNGSTIKGSTIINKAKIANSQAVATAVFKKATAIQGSTVIE